ncbi:pantothenate synthetase [Candidatus Nitrotoga sp. HW29]|uniref:pantoate--beta-alanine ligase n=1 Tax=Candidatus Nitrotoga sp. HW29 TaxID=2886963 RepID=UPI001EF1CA78|nr:pantoate--beta-alanine ligase [Candidatus Nitrotoga sp. HW29]CAH1906401.1 pantothenate synthetase [Candidatus Nitrotoga sp. HW29]
MRVIHTIAELRVGLRGITGIVLVPTMGNLHQGHLDLVRIARQHGQFVVVSIFVNPLQFGINEDYSKYPRTLEQDCKALEQCGTDVVFAPSEHDLYPQPQQVTVELPPVANELCGAFRPGHFRGAATVVLKLFNIVQPYIAVFGKKDYQQLYLMRQMTAQLNLPIEIIGGETVRASDGLALSSRNQYLNVAERTEAVFLYQNLVRTRQAIMDGATDFLKLERQVMEVLGAHGWRVDYVAIRSQVNLAEPTAGECSLVILAAAWLGQTRLIDNLEVLREG